MIQHVQCFLNNACYWVRGGMDKSQMNDDGMTNYLGGGDY
jgi:hypothetical protein